MAVLVPNPPKPLVVPVEVNEPNAGFWAVCALEPNRPPVAGAVAVGAAPNPVEVELVKPVPKPVEPNGLAADNGDCVVDWPNNEVVAAGAAVVAVLKLNGDCCC